MENWKEAIEDPGFITVFSAMLNYILVLELARRTDPDTMDGEITYEGISDRAKDLSLFLNDQEIIDATLYPNWATSLPEIGEEGYLTYSEVIAGKSKWFSGDNYIPYNYTHRHLVRWIKKSDEIIKKQHYEKTTIFKITD